MIINHSRKFIFIHIPKTAGTTLSSILEKLTTYQDIEIGTSELGSAYQKSYGKRFGIHKHSTAAQVKRLIGDDEFETFFSFAFVRNAFDRLSSLYRFLKAWKCLPQQKAQHFEKYNSFQEFLSGDIWLEDGWLFDEQTKWIMESNNSRKSAISFVGRLETFDRDIREVMQKIVPGLQIETNLRKNSSPKMGEFEWQSKDVDRVLERYESDFANFGYSQDPKSSVTT